MSVRITFWRINNNKLIYYYSNYSTDEKKYNSYGIFTVYLFKKRQYLFILNNILLLYMYLSISVLLRMNLNLSHLNTFYKITNIFFTVKWLFYNYKKIKFKFDFNFNRLNYFIYPIL
jgi:hypothetical protein